ncbi:MAG: hypothetical protein Q8J84_04695 [Flavobacteriaceae bacterium]|nr:hypothetical protein [Flavobacteriaceae bacterium]
MVLSINSSTLTAQTIPAVGNPVCAYCGTRVPNGIHSSSCPYYSSVKSTSKSSSTLLVPSTNINNMITGMVFQSLLSAVFSSGSGPSQKEIEAQQQAEALAAAKAAEEQRIQEAIALAKYHEMMKSYKLLEGTQSLGVKSLTNTNLDFKTLDGEAETLSANARKQFEDPNLSPISDSTKIGNGTPFFGDTMPIVDIQTLVDIENNPNVVDLRDSKKYIDEKIKNDSIQVVTLLRKNEIDGNGKPILQKPDCEKLGYKLKSYVNQRNQFQKTINLSQNELEIWETANRNALINAAKDGLEYFTGQLFEGLKNRGNAADRLQQIYSKNARQMAKEGINISEIQAKIDRLRSISSTGQIADLANNMNDWTTFIKDGMSSLLINLTNSNNEINEIFENPQMQKYFQTEKPELNALLDISKIAASNEVFGKWVAKKVPIIAVIEISIKQSYNALDWILSYNRIIKAQKINGGVLDTAKFIQKNIDDTYLALSECPN